jgi:hypothetical protein
MKELIKDTRRIAKKNGCKIFLSRSKGVKCNGETLRSNGYFDSEGRILAVAVNKPESVWLKVFLHESCHMDQWLENEPLWEKWGVGYNSFFEWLQGDLDLTKMQLLRSFADVIACEKDCEQRAIAKIRKYNLDINIELYTQSANTYLFSYSKVMQYKKWVQGIYLNKNLLRYAPKRFQSDYLNVPKKLSEEFDKMYS